MLKTAQVATSRRYATDQGQSGLHRTSQAAQDRWREDGYVLLPGAVDAKLCEAIAREIAAEHARLVAEGSGFSGGGSISGHLNCFPGQAAAKTPTLLRAAGITALLEKLHGGPVELTSLGCNVNLPGSHRQNFHTDGDWTTPFYIVNIALVPTNRLNGSTELIPGSAHKPLRYWQFAFGGLWRRGIRRTMRPGDVLLRPSTLWHRGMPNKTEQMRPMLALIYSAKGAAPKADLALNGGHIQFLANRFTSTPFGRAAEVVSVHLPWLHALIRIAKSLLAPTGRAT